MFPTINGGNTNEVFLVEFWTRKMLKLKQLSIQITLSDISHDVIFPPFPFLSPIVLPESLPPPPSLSYI